jgi:hypothetical protein
LLLVIGIACNNIGVEGAKAISNLNNLTLLNLSILLVISIGANNIGNEGAKALAINKLNNLKNLALCNI